MVETAVGELFFAVFCFRFRLTDSWHLVQVISTFSAWWEIRLKEASNNNNKEIIATLALWSRDSGVEHQTMVSPGLSPWGTYGEHGKRNRTVL